MEKLRKILIILIIMLFGDGIINNVQHFISIRQTYPYSFDDSIEILSVKKSVLVLNQDIEKLKMIKNSSLGSDVINSYTKMLEELNITILNCKFMNFEGNVELTQKDLYEMLYDYGRLNYTNMLNIYKKLTEIKPELSNSQQDLTKQIYTMMLFSNYMYETLVNNYNYSSLIDDSKYVTSTILSLYEEKLNTIHNITKLVIATDMGSGDSNE